MPSLDRGRESASEEQAAVNRKQFISLSFSGLCVHTYIYMCIHLINK